MEMNRRNIEIFFTWKINDNTWCKYASESTYIFIHKSYKLIYKYMYYNQYNLPFNGHSFAKIFPFIHFAEGTTSDGLLEIQVSDL